MGRNSDLRLEFPAFDFPLRFARQSNYYSYRRSLDPDPSNPCICRSNAGWSNLQVSLNPIINATISIIALKEAKYCWLGSPPIWSRIHSLFVSIVAVSFNFQAKASAVSNTRGLARPSGPDRR